MSKNNKILFVAAHPDDEVLGCGGTIAKYLNKGARVKILEKEIKEFKLNKIFTHFIHDLNIDHQYTAKAVITAARPEYHNSVDEILFFEINSSTDYQINSNGMQFQPSFL